MSDDKNKTGFLQVNNQIIDYWMAELTNAEFKTLLAIVRKTKGWNKPFDRISQSQISGLTGLTTRSVRTAVTSLAEKKLIIVEGSDTKVRLFSVNYSVINDVETDVTAMQKAIKYAEVISKTTEVISPTTEVISKTTEADFHHNIQTKDTINKQTIESELVVFEKSYESNKNHLMIGGIIPIGKRANDDELRPEIYKFEIWCKQKGVNESRKGVSIMTWFSKFSLEDRKRFYTFPDELNRNYHTELETNKKPKVTDERAAEIRAQYMGAMGF